MDREDDSGLLGSVSYSYRVDKYDLGPGQASGPVFLISTWLGGGPWPAVRAVYYWVPLTIGGRVLSPCYVLWNAEDVTVKNTKTYRTKDTFNPNVFKFTCMGKFLWSYKFFYVVVLLVLVLPLDKPAILDWLNLVPQLGPQLGPQLDKQDGLMPRMRSKSSLLLRLRPIEGSSVALRPSH